MDEKRIADLELMVVALQGCVKTIESRFDTTELKNKADILGAKLAAITMDGEAAIRTILKAAATVKK